MWISVESQARRSRASHPALIPVRPSPKRGLFPTHARCGCPVRIGFDTLLFPLPFPSSSPTQSDHPPTTCPPPSSPALTPLSSLRMTVLRSPYVFPPARGCKIRRHGIWTREASFCRASLDRIAGGTRANIGFSPDISNATSTDLQSFDQADKIQTLLGAAKIQEVEPIWSSIFAKVIT